MDKKEKKDYTPDMVFLIVGLVLLSIILVRIQEYLSYWNLNTLEFWEALRDFLLLHVWPLVKIAAVLLSVAAVIGTIDALRKLRQLNIKERETYNLSSVPLLLRENFPERKNERWEHVQGLMNSRNASDWRLAILEADVMLDEFLRSAGYHGDSIGEMLKSVEKSDFLTIESAWEAHKVRNRIAHDGSGYLLNEREAKQTISHFENVFKEFQII